MKRSITIENLKGIKNLSFQFPEKPGLYLLAGKNGSGKSTLMVCMRRLAFAQAFSHSFSKVEINAAPDIDTFKDASITYEVENEHGKFQVRYEKRGTNWVPRPRGNDEAGTCLRKFGFDQSEMITSDYRLSPWDAGDRNGAIIPTVQKNQTGQKNWWENLGPDVDRILGLTDRFSKLTVLRRNPNMKDYVYAIPDGNGGYYSENQFSAGERAILKLCSAFCYASFERASRFLSKQLLILLDEGELALHPTAQLALLQYLQDKLNEFEKKGIPASVFVSTHSPTMLKAVRPEQIILLEEQVEGTGLYDCVTPCYPARAIGVVDIDPLAPYDYVFFVEDEMAQSILYEMLRRLAKDVRYRGATYLVTPVGGYYETARMAVNMKNGPLKKFKVAALVDEDAFDGEPETHKRKFQSLRNSSTENQSMIRSLGFTPEVWMMEQLRDARIKPKEHETLEHETLKETLSSLGCNQLTKLISDVDSALNRKYPPVQDEDSQTEAAFKELREGKTLTSAEYDLLKKARKKAKDALEKVLEYLKNSSSRDDISVRNQLVSAMVQDMNLNELKKTVCPHL